MSRFQVFLFATLWVTAVLAAPAPHLRQKRSFKIPRVQQHNYVPDGTFALRKAYRKFGLGTLDTYPGVSFSPKGDAPTISQNSNEDSEVSASIPQNDAQFLAPVMVGGQILVLNIDSGSSDMWVFNTGLPARSQLGHTLYNPSQSTTVTGMNGSSFEITYGDGSFASGPVVSDVVDIGGATVNEQAIGIPTNVSESFTRDVHSNGLVGLGFSKINTIRPEQQKTFFDNILPDLSQPVFTASLKSGVVGAYEFGNIDATQFQGEITTVPVDNSRGFWEFGSAKFAIGDGAIQTVSTGPGTAIADTGTSLILMDDEVVQAYYGEVAGANLDLRVGGFVFPCDEPLPDLRVAVGDSYMATVSGKLMNFAKAGPDSRTGDPACFGGLQSNQNADIQIFGDVFFKSQFVVFNGAEPPSLGLAPHRPSSSFITAAVFRAIGVQRRAVIVPTVQSAKYSSKIMPSACSDCDQDGLCSSCSTNVNAASDDGRSRCSLENIKSLDGSTTVENGNRHLPGNPSLGSSFNPPFKWPQDMTHSDPNIIVDPLAIDASGIKESVAAHGYKFPDSGHLIPPRQDGHPFQCSIRQEANEKPKAAAKHKGDEQHPEQHPEQQTGVQEDEITRILSSSSDHKLISGIHPPPQPSELSTSSTRNITQSDSNKTLSTLDKQLPCTQAGIGWVHHLPIRAKEFSIMDVSQPEDQRTPAPENDGKSVPPAEDQSKPQPQQKKEKKAKAPKQASAATSLPLSPALIDLRVGHILRCIPHENADSLYVSTIAMGDPEGSENSQKDEETGRIVRTVCSGLRGLIPIEQMQDRKVIVMANLKPVTMRGIKSAAMVLAASPPPKEGEDSHSADRVVELVSPPGESEGGDKVYFEGWEYGEGKGPEKVLNPKKKQWDAVQPGLYTSEELTVVFDAGRTPGVKGEKGELVVEGGKGKCKVFSLKGARLS